MSLKKRPLTKSPISLISEGICVSVELKITRGYGKLLGLPEAADRARMVSLDRIANCEIRMFKTPETSTIEVPLFWIELVDLCTQSSLDSCRCDNVGEAVAVFEAFASQARCLNGSCPDSGTED